MFRAHVAQVRGYTWTLVDSADCDDIVAATFRTAWQRFEQVPPLAEKAWLLGVARQHIRNHVRSERRRQALVGALESLRPPADVEMHHGRIDPITTGPLWQAIGQLSEAEREVIQLAAWHELQPSEIAVVLDISQAAARVRLHRARQHLETLLRDTGDEGVRDV